MTLIVAAAPLLVLSAVAVPFVTVTLKAPVIASVNISGPRDGEFLAADELRFAPLLGK